MLKLRPGWTAIPHSGYVLFSSDSRSYKISVSEELMCELFDGDNFRVSIASLSSSATALVNKLMELYIVSPCKQGSDQTESLQSRYFHAIGNNPVIAENNLERAHVLILGLGGTGGTILQHLAPSGIKKFSLVDIDRVEKSNLQRQFLYDIESIGELKADMATNYILKREPASQIIPMIRKISTQDDLVDIIEALPRIDFCAVCIDEPVGTIFDIVSGVLWERDIPFIYGGVMIQSGFWGPVFAKRFSSLSPQDFKVWTSVDGADNISPLKICFSPYNTIVGGFMASAMLHYLSGSYHKIEFAHGTFANFDKMSFGKIISKNSRGRLED